jgi:hypothetical protein
MQVNKLLDLMHLKSTDREFGGVKRGQLLKLDGVLGILQALVRWPDRFDLSSRARCITLPREETKGGGFSAVTKTNATRLDSDLQLASRFELR